MYTIVMDKYKNLNTTIYTTLFQHESLTDKIQFLIPPEYQGVDLSEYTVTLKYVDPNGNFHSEVLELNAELYKDYLQYVLPVTSKLTQVVGNLNVRLTLIKFQTVDETTTEIDRMETNSTTIMINKPNGFYDSVDFEDIEAFKAKLNEVNKELVDTREKMADDLILTDDQLQLSHEGTPIGIGVEIVIPGDPDDEDKSHDGVIEVDELEDTVDTPEENIEFVEV